jgi:excisionase family DNA binding protein
MATTTIERSKLLTPVEAGEILGVRPDTLTVWRCRRSPDIPFHKIGSLVRYDRADLEHWIESRRVGGDES